MTTKAEERWMQNICRIGCVVCHDLGFPGTPAAVHHLKSGGRRIDDLHTIPLCPDHHKQQIANQKKIAVHHNRRQFEAAYGTELELLERTKDLVKRLEALTV